MGTGNVEETSGKRGRQDYVESLLNDLGALQVMLDQGAIESEPLRVGAEQELFLVDRNWQPAPVVHQTLAESRDPHLTPELGALHPGVQQPIPWNVEGTALPNWRNN